MDDWQNKCVKQVEKCKYIFENKELCDCEFLLDGQQVLGHKLILAMGSPVFYKMFYGDLPENSGPIIVTDIRPEVFSQMLCYIYTDEVTLSDYKIAYDLYSAAKKYIVKQLEKECIDCLKRNVNPDNAIVIYEFAKFYNEEELEKQCLKEIQLKTSNIISNENFINALESTVTTILDLKRLNITCEGELVVAVCKWANAESSRKGMTSRECGEKLMKKLRLLTLTADEFVDSLATTDILLDNEKLDIILRIIRPDTPPMTNGLCPNISKRKSFKQAESSILEITDIIESRCDGSEWFTSTFVTNENIDLLGVELCLQVNPEGGKYEENLMVKVGFANEEDYLAEGSLYRCMDYNQKAQVMLDISPAILPNTQYAIHVFLCKPGIYPIGRQNNLRSTHTNIEIEFLSHSAWEQSHPWNTTVLTSIIYSESSE